MTRGIHLDTQCNICTYLQNFISLTLIFDPRQNEILRNKIIMLEIDIINILNNRTMVVNKIQDNIYKNIALCVALEIFENLNLE